MIPKTTPRRARRPPALLLAFALLALSIPGAQPALSAPASDDAER